MIENIVESWTVGHWIAFYLIGSIIAGPLCVKIQRLVDRLIKLELFGDEADLRPRPHGGWFLAGLLGSWLALSVATVLLLPLLLIHIAQKFIRYLDTWTISIK